ncbi:leucine-rich repeat domain-containing protein [Flavobacterium sp. UMI-01]|uniref:leucine-rich repeat domain-containing protein n=1 Tax=Flavobacterium sp. UMI-01 TaxID=1441053 RepID=UPI001C7D51DC|nr:leucine-rich repeat domain-containing protein [Flavobacterium sp. UMI-01]GIZ09738.1 hypothetical protein FUMI01_24650 [Flavobacterium sp. UMI-01]
MKKTLLVLGITLFTLTVCQAQAVGDTFTDGDFTYKVTSVAPNEVTVTGTTSAATTLSIPATASDAIPTVYSVTSIGTHIASAGGPEGAFEAKTAITAITLPSTVTTIGYDAFRGCTALATVNLDNITTVLGSAFQSSGLTSTIPSGLAVIGASAFQGSKITSLTLSNPALTTVGTAAFRDCLSLVTANLTNSGLTSLSNTMFQGCSELTTLSLPTTVTSLILACVKNCPKLVNLTIPAASITMIDGSAFYGCTGLTSIPNLENVTSIGGSGFWGCTNLESLSVSSALTTIGDNAFQNCTKLTAINTSGVTTIGANAFRDCNAITSLDLNKVTAIGSNGLGRMTGLTTINLPKVQTIADYAFVYDTNLTEINIGNALTSIGTNALYSIGKLATLKVNVATPVLPLAAFVTGGTPKTPIGIGTLAKLYVPVGAKPAYVAATGWSAFLDANIIEDPTLSTKNFQLESNWDFYPNPTKELITVKSKQSEKAAIAVYDLNGRVVLQQEVTDSESQINLSNVSSGIYLFKVKTDTGEFVKRIVKQ